MSGQWTCTRGNTRCSPSRLVMDSASSCSPSRALADTVRMVIRQDHPQTLSPTSSRRHELVNMILLHGRAAVGEVEAGVVQKLLGVRIAVGSGAALRGHAAAVR